MTINLKRKAIIAASAATVISLAAISPSMAHTRTTTTTTGTVSATDVAHVHASVAVTITGVPTTVTDARAASRGAKFVAYKLDATATAIPVTQPTTGGKPLKVKGATLTDGTLTGVLSIDAGAASTTTNYAIYNAAGVGSFVVVTVDAAGVATATTATALTATYVAPTAPAFGEGKGVKGERGMKQGKKHGKH